MLKWKVYVTASVAAALVVGACSVVQKPPAPVPVATPQPVTGQAPAQPTSPTVIVQQPSASAATQAVVPEESAFPTAKMELNKYAGPVGTKFTISGTGYPANAEVALTWLTYDGRWQLEQEEVVFVGPRYTERKVEMGKVTTDAQGRFEFPYTAPEDFGGVHDIFTRIGGKYATKTAFNTTASFTVSPLSGPIGTPVQIKATGLGYKQQLAQWEAAWDNGFTGYMTAVNTRGTATGNIRMAGPPGRHVLKIWRNYRGIPYLNPHQGPFGALPPSEFTMNVTEGVHASPAVWEHPLSVETVRPAPQAVSTGGASLGLSSDRGTVGSMVTVSGKGFPASKPVTLTWASRTGQKITPTGLLEGFEELLKDLPSVTADKNGNFTAEIKVHDDFAGSHRITATGGDRKAEAYYSIFANIAEFAPTVKVGEPVKIRLRGVGWTIQGKTYGVVYDNKYLGYICSFSTRGYIELDLPAEVKPGVHIIDLYPAVYEGKDPTPNIYSSPNLTYLTDHPGGVLPAFRLTLTVKE